MPIVSSNIIEDSAQADGRRWVTEEHIDSTGETYRIIYLAASDADVNQIMLQRVPNIDQRLIDREINRYLARIENGLNVIGLDYTETTQKYRSLQFLLWAKEKIQAQAFEALQYAYLVTDPYTGAQINTLILGTDFEGKANKIKAWADKLRLMKVAMTDAETAAGEV